MAHRFRWVRDLSDFLVGSLRGARGFDPEQYFSQLHGAGFTHVTINGLGVDRPFETGPPGDVYSWFYDYSPDLDQFVGGDLTTGLFPEEYLRANLTALRRNATHAAQHGLIPGLHINSPRSLPEEFWQRYPFLRGARVDHPRESFRPRYTLAMAHPAVQAHYRSLMQHMLEQVPDLGFIHVWTNDSGAGFEFTSSLYAGRNGGPYLLREWKSEEEITRRAADNVLTYYRLLLEEGRKGNGAFRLVCDLGPFYTERPHIIDGLGKGIDAGDFGYFEGPDRSAEADHLRRVGAAVHRKIDICSQHVLGVPFPWVVHERLKQALDAGTEYLLTTITPGSLAPFDINTEILRTIQSGVVTPVDEMVRSCAERWSAGSHAADLVNIWRLVDASVRRFPAGVPMMTFAFPWFRLWVRPFVPDIDAIPEAERSYYENFLLATFNNPNRVDLNNDMLWNFLTPPEAREKAAVIDSAVIPRLNEAIRLCDQTARVVHGETENLFVDQRDRITAQRCFVTTLRNMMAWTAGVHGYRDATDETGMSTCLAEVRAMISNETKNTRDLLSLWNTSGVHFMPVAEHGESLHIYGVNFGDLLQAKVDLMERHRDDIPYIDPDYMWRMPAPKA